MGVKLSEIDIRVAEASLRPQLDFTGSVGSTGRQADAGEAATQTLRFENTIWSAGLIFQLPLQNRKARGESQAAHLGGDRATLEAADLELAIRDGVARFAARIKAAGQRVELARAAVGFAAQNLEAEKARFSVGQSTNNDVLLRQQELKEAEIKTARATVDLLINDTALTALTGEILERYGMVLRGT
jgi:outer membrane protein TolC